MEFHSSLMGFHSFDVPGSGKEWNSGRLARLEYQIRQLRHTFNLPPSQHPNLPALQLSNFPTLQHPNFPASQLSNFPTLQHPNFPASQLPNFPTSQLCNFPSFQLPIFPTFQLTNCSYPHPHLHKYQNHNSGGEVWRGGGLGTLQKE